MMYSMNMLTKQLLKVFLQYAIGFSELYFGGIDSEDSYFHVYNTIKFSYYPYTLQKDLNINGKLVAYDEIVCDGTYLCHLNFKSR